MKLLKLLRIVILILFIASVLLYAGTEYYYRGTTDKTPPVLSCDSPVLDLSVNAGEAEYFRGLSATDDRDGDLTQSIQLVGVSRLVADRLATAYYAVFDSSSNAATITRTIRYTDYHAPRFALSGPLVYAPEEDIDLSLRLTASDVLDGDISQNISLAVDGIEYGKDGSYDITVLVSNSRGDYASLPLKLCISSSYAHARPLSLTQYILYLDQNAAFDPAAYIKVARGGGSVEIHHEVNTAIPGNYIVEYRYIAANGSTYSEYLTVSVLATEVTG